MQAKKWSRSMSGFKFADVWIPAALVTRSSSTPRTRTGSLLRQRTCVWGKLLRKDLENQWVWWRNSSFNGGFSWIFQIYVGYPGVLDQNKHHAFLVLVVDLVHSSRWSKTSRLSDKLGIDGHDSTWIHGLLNFSWLDVNPIISLSLAYLAYTIWLFEVAMEHGNDRQLMIFIIHKLALFSLC